MAQLQLIDESFVGNRTESYELSIQFSLNGFSFCVVDTTRDYRIALVHDTLDSSAVQLDDWGKAVQDVASRYPLITQKFRKVHFAYDYPHFSLVPLKYFEPTQAKSLLSLNFQLGELDEIRYNMLQEDMVSVFALPSLLASSWLNIQPNSKFRALHEPLLILAKEYRKRSNNRNAILLYLDSQLPIMAIVSQQGALHCGSLGSSGTEDIAYHTINTCQRLHIDMSVTSVYIAGSKQPSESLKAILDKYFSSSQTEMPVELAHYTYQLFKYKKQFLPLFNLSL